MAKDDVDVAGLREQFEHFNTVQDEVKQKVEAVHEALYHPDEGLFARIKTSADESREKDNEIEKKLNEQVTELKGELEELQGWRRGTMSVARWVLGIWSTTTVGLVVKLLYDLIKNHIRFV